MQARAWVAFGLTAAYLIAGVAGFFADFDSTSDTVIWLVLLWGGAALIVAGIFLAEASGWLAATLMSVGAVAGGLALFWTILVPVAVASIIAMSFVIARRSPKPA